MLSRGERPPVRKLTFRSDASPSETRLAMSSISWIVEFCLCDGRRLVRGTGARSIGDSRHSSVPALGFEVLVSERRTVPHGREAPSPASASSARARVPQLGRGSAGCGSEARGSSHSRFTSSETRVGRAPSAPRHDPHPHGPAESPAGRGARRDHECTRRGTRSLRLPAEPVLAAVESHPSDRRSRGSEGVVARNERTPREDLPRAQRSLAPVRLRLRGPLPRSIARHAARGARRARLRAAEREAPRTPAPRNRSVLVGSVVRRLETGTFAASETADCAGEHMAAARRLATARADRDRRISTSVATFGGPGGPGCSSAPSWALNSQIRHVGRQERLRGP